MFFILGFQSTILYIIFYYKGTCLKLSQLSSGLTTLPSRHLSHSAWKLKTMLLLPPTKTCWVFYQIQITFPYMSLRPFPSVLSLWLRPLWSLWFILWPPHWPPWLCLQPLWVTQEASAIINLSKTLLLFAVRWSQADQLCHSLSRASLVKFLYFSSIKGSQSDYLPAF